ncbi:hypothetical protein N7534_001785 [Penicillium rubens]|nr:hypothetical protein N7534_001785 [Penicillium rubens]
MISLGDHDYQAYRPPKKLAGVISSALEAYIVMTATTRILTRRARRDSYQSFDPPISSRKHGPMTMSQVTQRLLVIDVLHQLVSEFGQILDLFEQYEF